MRQVSSFLYSVIYNPCCISLGHPKPNAELKLCIIDVRIEWKGEWRGVENLFFTLLKNCVNRDHSSLLIHLIYRRQINYRRTGRIQE